RSRRTFLVLADPKFDPSETQVASFIIKLHGFRRRGLRRQLDVPASAFRVLMTHDAGGRAILLWQLPGRHVAELRRALDSSFGVAAVRLEPGAHLLPKPVVGYQARLELQPGRRDDWPFRRLPIALDPKSDFAHATARPRPGELRVVALDVRPLPPQSWRGWIASVLGERQKPTKALDEADRFQQQDEQRAIWHKVVDKQGNRDPLFEVQTLALAVAPGRQDARQAIANLRGGFDQWLSNNFFEAVGWRTWGSNAFWRAPGFDHRLATARFTSDHVMAGWELGKLLTPPDTHNTCPDVVRLEAAELQPPEEVVQKRRRGVTVAMLPGDREAVLTPDDLTTHVDVMAPTGAGKSTLLGNMVLGWADLGLPCVLVDPNKGDTVTYVLDRLPRRHWDRVVLIDPSRQDRSVAINVLDTPARHGTVADQVVSVFARSYGQYWGPRGATILRMAVLTLLRHPGSTLCDASRLLLDEHVQRELTQDLHDEGLEMAWKAYEPAQAESLLWKLSDVLAFRPEVRHLLGRPRSTVDLSKGLSEDAIVLISLPTGQIGEDTSALLGGLLISRIWQIIQGRSAVPVEQRRHLLTVIDEFPKLVSVPTSWKEFLAEARGYRAPLVLAHQDRSQLGGGDLASAVDSNARTKVFFQMEHDDARVAATQARPLTAAQLEGLERFHAAVRLCVDGHVKPAFIAPTPVPRASLGHARALAEHSLRRYGRATTDSDAEGAPPDPRRHDPRQEEALDWDA
ncbi:MAG: type IV secretory system conjugative DNA transfer family protein, partial [Candidatus Dormibacteraeota bacterium]|nr:type IV secretory system conjugative DNA transfer family protein [Candidatus Dormibacteraeota bacterium]